MENNRIPLLPVGVRVFLVILTYVIFTIIFQVIGGIIMGINLEVLDKPENITLKDLLLLHLFILPSSLFVTFFFRKYSDLQSISSMGFPIKKYKKDLVWGFLCAALIISAGTLILFISNNIIIVGYKLESNKLLYGFLLFTIVALVEEILCRGYVLNNLMGAINKYAALSISSLLFALMHSFNSNLSWLGMLNLFLAGILLGSSYVYTKNLWFPISLHLFWNFIQACIFDYNVSGLNVNSILTFKLPAQNILNGGSFGFEGSIICTIFTIGAIALIHFLYLKKN